MRWGKKKTQEEELDIVETRPTIWTDRFAGIGARLDDSSHNLNEVAVSITGPEIRISALGWDARAHYDGWSSVYAEMIDSELSVDQPGAARIWEQRLRGVGEFLDAKDEAISSPCVLAVDGGLLINAMVDTGDASESITWHLKGGQTR